MLNIPNMQACGLRLVVATLLGALLAACGQKGPLFMPTAPAAAGRATLTETLNPMAPPAARAASAPTPPIAPGSTSSAEPVTAPATDPVKVP